MTTKEAIRLMRNLPTMCEFTDAYGEPIDSDAYYEALDMAISALQAQEWVLCKERLPEVGRSVLFSRRSMCTREGCLQADGKWWQYWWYELLNADQVTAWKPMPEPYREEDTNVNVKS